MYICLDTICRTLAHFMTYSYLGLGILVVKIVKKVDPRPEGQVAATSPVMREPARARRLVAAIQDLG